MKKHGLSFFTFITFGTSILAQTAFAQKLTKSESAQCLAFDKNGVNIARVALREGEKRKCAQVTSVTDSLLDRVLNDQSEELELKKNSCKKISMFKLKQKKICQQEYEAVEARQNDILEELKDSNYSVCLTDDSYFQNGVVAYTNKKFDLVGGYSNIITERFTVNRDSEQTVNVSLSLNKDADSRSTDLYEPTELDPSESDLILKCHID